eukprot:2265173-Pleurochrysis_carterae.AAC.1
MDGQEGMFRIDSGEKLGQKASRFGRSSGCACFVDTCGCASSVSSQGIGVQRPRMVLWKGEGFVAGVRAA